MRKEVSEENVLFLCNITTLISLTWDGLEVKYQSSYHCQHKLNQQTPGCKISFTQLPYNHQAWTFCTLIFQKHKKKANSLSCLWQGLFNTISIYILKTLYIYVPLLSFPPLSRYVFEVDSVVVFKKLLMKHTELILRKTSSHRALTSIHIDVYHSNLTRKKMFGLSSLAFNEISRLKWFCLVVCFECRDEKSF